MLAVAHEQRTPGYRCYLVLTTLTKGEPLDWEALPAPLQMTWEAVARAALPSDLISGVQRALTELQRLLKDLTRK